MWFDMNKFLKIIFKKIIIFSLICLCIVLSSCDKTLENFLNESTQFIEIRQKFNNLEPSYFLDYLSTLDLSSIKNNYFLYDIYAMRDYSIALDPAFRYSPLQAIKNLQEIKDIYYYDYLLYKLNIDIDKEILDLEYRLILNNNYKRNNKLYFGRLNNATPISFQLIDKIGNDYLILQNSVYDLDLSKEEVYKDGICVLNDNEYIKRSFELENDIIKNIFILSEADYQKYKNVNKYINSYLDIKKADLKEDYLGNKNIKSVNCETKKDSSNVDEYFSYWVRDNILDDANKVCIVNEIRDAAKYLRYSIRLAILVDGDLYENK